MSRMKGELHPTKQPLVRQILSHMDDSVKLIGFFSGVTTSRDSNGHTKHLPRGCLTVYRYKPRVLFVRRSSPRTKMIYNSTASRGDRKKKGDFSVV